MSETSSFIRDDMTHEQILQGIHECVCGSIVHHVLKLPTSLLIEYLSTFPYYRGADILYYLLLKKVGREAYYAPDGRHLVTIHPELIGVYISAGQDIKAPSSCKMKQSDVHDESMEEVLDQTIYPLIKANISRTVTCERYQMRQSIIIGEASFVVAIGAPSISLNIPTYQHEFREMFRVDTSTQRGFTTIIAHDYWEAIQSMHVNFFQYMLIRMSIVKGTFPNLWNLALRKYYSEQLLRLKLYDYLPKFSTGKIVTLNTLFPELIRLPSDLDTLGLRLWFLNKTSRAYLLGFDISDGIPSDKIISEKLQYLQKIGIERYADEITRIHIDNGKLTGQIGMMVYPHLIGKKLINTKDMFGKLIHTYYPYDLFPVVCGDGVCIITLQDIISLVDENERLSRKYLRSLLVKEKIPYLTETPDDNEVNLIFKRLIFLLEIERGIPARIRLVEIAASGSLA